ncbi:MAG TPA: hypothetical protein VM889_04425, partial [Candidatus Thermoplasmatota archaeon]|nr:hypothetical protein [Candidatus Thermoplasmatota archaeon]
MSLEPRRAAFAAVALALLLAPALAAPVAGAQGGVEPSFTIRFNRDPAHYLQGESVAITVQSTMDEVVLKDSGYTIQVRCLQCPDGSYVAPYARERVFPRDFLAASGASPAPALQPRWNGTWRVEILGPAKAPVLSRDFSVWMAELYKFPSNTPEATLQFIVQTAGWRAGEAVSISLSQRNAHGGHTTLLQRDLVASSSGLVRFPYTLSRADASRLDCPPRPEGHCWAVQLTAYGRHGTASRPSETIHFVIKPATLRLVTLAEPSLNREYERTEREVVFLRLAYPDGLPYRPTLLEDPDATVPFRVERTRAGSDADPVVVDRFGATWNEGLALWTAVWRIPKNLTLDEAGAYRFRLAIEPAKDPWGNRLPDHRYNTTRIRALAFEPIPRLAPPEAERTETVTFHYNITYRDGAPLTTLDLDNKTLVACFIRADESPGAFPCRDRLRATSKYANGTWNFSHRFPRDYQPLGPFRLVIDGTADSAKDKWGNAVPTTVSDPFTLTTAAPRILFTTAVLGDARNESRGFDRGDTVTVTARLLYHDGKPVNSTYHKEGRALPVVIDRVNDKGVSISTETIRLAEVDKDRGRFQGAFSIPRTSEEAPLGRWTFRVDVADNATPSNVNSSTFGRAVKPAVIQAPSRVDPPARVFSGNTAAYQFSLRFADGTTVKGDDVGTRLLLNVYRWENDKVGGLAQAGLVPSYDAAAGAWTARWSVPTSVWSGTYVFKPTGTDRHGNVVDANARSAPFTVVVPLLERPVITDPPARAVRGDTVYVVFDGRDGDKGPDSTGRPIIGLQRLASNGRWETEILDTLERADANGDWLASWNTTLSSTLGIYRFAFAAKDARNANVVSFSGNISLAPANVTRELSRPAPTTIAKGQTYRIGMRSERGDVPLDAFVLHRGRSIANADFRITSPLEWNVTWRPNFGVDLGEYTVFVRGRDVFGNLIRFAGPPVVVSPTTLLAQAALDPPAAAGRHQEVGFGFVLRYPDGQEYTSSIGLPDVVIEDEAGVAADANVSWADGRWTATWRPLPDTPLGEYRFVVGGRDASGNDFPRLESRPFRLEPGVISRPFAREPPVTFTRMTVFEATVLAEPNEVAEFVLQYSGGVFQVSDVFNSKRAYADVATLPAERDPNSGLYRLRHSLPRDAPLGAYRLALRATDGDGNEVVATSRPFVLDKGRIQVSLTAGDLTVRPGGTVQGTFRAQYRDGTPFTQEDGIPGAVVLWNGQVTKETVDVEYDAIANYWRFAWKVPENLPHGKYWIQIFGADREKNEMQRLSTPDTDIKA